ncbi:MAG: hypothetical protein JWM72_4190 [Actinomycetia bacterium]|nr:hypothetical protein [Actinomycetes bacterium]MDQ1459226.1 hypothetical protein [Actinomycetota bacterium]
MEQACNRRAATILPAQSPFGGAEYNAERKGFGDLPAHPAGAAETRRNRHGKGGGQVARETVGAAGWPGPHDSRRVIATFSNEDSCTTAQPLRNASPPEQHTGTEPDFVRPGSVNSETEGVE